EAYADDNYSDKQWAVDDEIVGTKVIRRFAYKDSLSVYKYIDEKDSLTKVVPQLRMALSPGFFKDLLSESVDSASISTATGFNNHVKGLYLSVDEASMTGTGGLVTFRGAADITGIELVYRQPNGETGEDADIDTIRTLLPTSVS